MIIDKPKRTLRQRIKTFFSNRDANGIPYGYPKEYNNIEGDIILQQDPNKKMLFEEPIRSSINRMPKLKGKIRLAKGGTPDKDPKQLNEVTIYGDINNPRYKSYKDSLDLYNNSQDLIKEFDRMGYVPSRGHPMGYIDPGHPPTKYSTAYSMNMIKKVVGKTPIDKNIFAKYPEVYDVQQHSNSLYSVDDLLPDAVNKNNKIRNLLSTNIAPLAVRYYEDQGDSAPIFGRSSDYEYNIKNNIGGAFPLAMSLVGGNDIRVVFDYTNVKPKQTVVLKDPTDIPVNNSSIPIKPNKPNKNHPIEAINKLEPRQFVYTPTKPNTRTPSQPIGAQRGDRIFFQYSPKGKNNYINYGDGKGRETLTNKEADKLYNKWNESGLMNKLGETGQSNYGGKKKFAKGGKTGDPPFTNQYDKQKQWLVDWFNNPEAKRRLMKVAGLEATDNPKQTKRRDKYASDIISSITNNINTVQYKNVPQNNRFSGQYDIDNHVALIADNSKSTSIHEGTHSGTPEAPFYEYIKKTIKHGHKQRDRYMEEPREIYSRIMELRYNSNIEPGQIIDTPTLETIKQHPDNKATDLFNYFNDDVIINLMNGLSKNNDTKDIQQVKSGGRIMKNTLRVNNRFNPPKMSIGGVTSMVSGLYGIGQGIGQGMLKANQNEYGLIDNNTRHANNMQANLVFDPVGHIANVFGTGGSWDDLGYWGGKKQAAAADKDLASIKRLEATGERQAKLQMGRVGASTYDQYGYPTQSLYAKGGKLTDPPGGTLSKSDAYWLAVHGSKENAGQDRKMWKFVYDELYKNPNPERIYMSEAMPGQVLSGEFVKTNKIPSKRKPFGGYLTPDGLKSLGKKASRALNVLVPGAEDMPIIPNAMPDRPINFGNTSLKCGGKTMKRSMKRAQGGMIPVKLDNDEIVYDQFGNPAPIVTNSPVSMKAGGTHILGGKGGTDKVNAMLPPNAVVISDDNGEKDKLMKAFRNNPSKETIKQFMNRAVAKQNKGNGLYLGGNPWEDIDPMGVAKTASNWGINPIGNYPLNSGFRFQNANPNDMYGINIPSGPTQSTYNRSLGMLKPSINTNPVYNGFTPTPIGSGIQPTSLSNYNNNQPYTNTTPVTDFNLAPQGDQWGKAPGSIGRQTQQPRNPETGRTKMGDAIRNPDTWQAIGTIGELGLGVANTIVNTNALRKLKKLPFPKYQQSRFIAQDPRYMKSFYSQQKGDLDQSALNTMEYMRRNTSGSGLSNNYAQLNANLLRGKSGLSGQESATIGDINNQNAKDKTQFLGTEAIRKMGYDAAKLSHKIGLINTGVALNQNTINTFQGFTNNLKQSAYQSKQLDAMARQYGLPARLPGETLDEYQKRVYRTLN